MLNIGGPKPILISKDIFVAQEFIFALLGEKLTRLKMCFLDLETNVKSKRPCIRICVCVGTSRRLVPETERAI